MSALWTALHERSHDGLVEDYIKLMADNYRLERTVETLKAPLSKAEWATKCTSSGTLNMESVNEIFAQRGKA